MKPIIEYALSLLQATQSLSEAVSTDDWDSLEDLQQQRAFLVEKLDKESHQIHDQETVQQVRKIIAESRSKEKALLEAISTKRDAISQEHQQLQRGRSAAKAYGKFS